MTAFAREGRETPWGALVWELRSVNHRYLDISLRLPDELRALEPGVRERIQSRLERGKVDAGLRWQPQESVSGLALDAGAAGELLRMAGQAGALAPGLGPLQVIDVLRWPGVLRTPAVDVESLTRVSFEVLTSALDQLVATRMREGERLKQAIAQRLRSARELLVGIVPLLPELTQNFRERLSERLAELAQGPDPARVEQEIVIYASRIDVSEELDRLAAHIAEVERLLDRNESVGRRLDFLMQELNREANTLGSKAADLRLTNAAVDLKVLIEQMREQVQNIE